MIRITRTTSDNPHFQLLVADLDRYLAHMDGDEHAFYAQYNKTSGLNHVVVAYENDVPMGCGAIKPFEEGVMEVKRMYVLPSHRGKGIATRVLMELEKWSAELGYKRCVLETGKRQKEAAALYSSRGYTAIPNYGQYAGVENSLCFEKFLS